MASRITPPDVPVPGRPIQGHLSHPGDGKERARIDAFKTKVLDLGGNWTRIWSTSGETYIDVRGNGRSRDTKEAGA